MLILDSTASVRGIWYQKNNPFTVFMDMRKGSIHNGSHGDNIRIYEIYPDVLAKWQYLPFKNESFDMVVFDPPFIFGTDEGSRKSWIRKKYGMMLKSSWREDLRAGVLELFRALKNEGVFILKWSDIEIDVKDALKLFPTDPMFGTNTGKDNNTHWICFIKHRQNLQLEDFC